MYLTAMNEAVLGVHSKRHQGRNALELNIMSNSITRLHAQVNELDILTVQCCTMRRG